jgi:hypothetical protein
MRRTTRTRTPPDDCGCARHDASQVDDDGKTQTFDFDTLDQGIGLEYYVAVDVRDKTGADSQWREVETGDRRRMRFEIAGRGPMPPRAEQ